MIDKVKALEELRVQLRHSHAHYDAEKVEIGDFTYGSPIILSWGEKNARCRIGKFCSIGGNVQIYLGGNHHNDWCTTYPFNALLPEIWGDLDDGVAATKGDVIIGNDVWIASNVTLMSGVTIGDGATIANGAVVTRNVPENTLVCGNPAKVKTVFYHKIPSILLHWWDWPLEKIAAAAPILMSADPAALVEFDKHWEVNQFDG